MGSWPGGLVTAVVAAVAAWLLTLHVAAVVPAGSGRLRARVHVLLAAAAGLGAALVADGVAELVALATTGAGWAPLWRALLAAIVLVLGYFVLAFISPSGLGLGDVKFAGVVGGFLGWFGWSHVAVGTLLGFVLNAVVALVVLLSGRGAKESQIPFGPSMVAGAVPAVGVVGT